MKTCLQDAIPPYLTLYFLPPPSFSSMPTVQAHFSFIFPLLNKLHSHNCLLETWRNKEEKGNAILHVLLCVVPFVCLHSFI